MKKIHLFDIFLNNKIEKVKSTKKNEKSSLKFKFLNFLCLKREKKINQELN
jgi:hypothetical protein